MICIKNPFKTALVISSSIRTIAGNHPPDGSLHTFTVTVDYGISPYQPFARSQTILPVRNFALP